MKQHSSVGPAALLGFLIATMAIALLAIINDALQWLFADPRRAAILWAIVFGGVGGYVAKKLKVTSL